MNGGQAEFEAILILLVWLIVTLKDELSSFENETCTIKSAALLAGSCSYLPVFVSERCRVIIVIIAMRI